MSNILDLKNHLIGIFLGEHPEGFDWEFVFIVWIADHAAFVEDSLNGLLEPLSIWLLSLHEEFDALLDRLLIWISGFQETDNGPRCLHHK